jgi:hypothetical protein
VAGKLNVSTLSSITANIGSITAGNIRGTRLQIGGGTNEDIYFEDSGIRFYDAGSQYLKIYKSGYADLDIILASTFLTLRTTSGILQLGAGATYGIALYSTGTLQMHNVSSAPTGHSGDIAYNSTQHRFQMYVGGGTNAWGYELMSMGW